MKDTKTDSQRKTLTKEWNDTLAAYEYSLISTGEVSYGGEVQGTVEESKIIATGDKAWAVRQSKHYGVPVPEDNTKNEGV